MSNLLTQVFAPMPNVGESDTERAVPAKHFAFPPYSAHPSGGKNDLWYVANVQGFNCLTFPNKPGAVFTSEKRAKEIADEWNKEKA